MNVVMTESIVVNDTVSCSQVWAGWFRFTLLLVEVIIVQVKKKKKILLCKYDILASFKHQLLICYFTGHGTNSLTHTINLLLTEYNFRHEFMSTIKLDITSIRWNNFCCGEKWIIMQAFSVTLRKVLQFMIYIF